MVGHKRSPRPDSVSQPVPSLWTRKTLRMLGSPGLLLARATRRSQEEQPFRPQVLVSAPPLVSRGLQPGQGCQVRTATSLQGSAQVRARLGQRPGLGWDSAPVGI